MNPAIGVTLTAAANAFDRVAGSYDELFTHTAIGRAQRNQVWVRLLAAFPPGSRIVELNCGTGEDARYLARRGRSVFACDASAGMIEFAKRYTAEEGRLSHLQFLQLANEDLDRLAVKKPFDGAFSNFSGLNCVADLRAVAHSLARLVRPRGRLLLCLWSRICLAEILWFALHGQLKKAVRRLPGNATARIAGATISVSYPSVRAILNSFSPWFVLHSRRAVGLFVPPSYVEPSIPNPQSLLPRLERLDGRYGAWPILRDVGDHVLLEFRRCA
jgi:SAM-dependent methyltransferase